MHIEKIQVRGHALNAPLPMMQGEALRQIIPVAGHPQRFGDVVDLPISEVFGLYMDGTKGHTRGESVWLDDGLSALCLAYRIHDNPDAEWTMTATAQTEHPGVTISANMEVIFNG